MERFKRRKRERVKVIKRGRREVRGIRKERGTE